MCATCGCGSRAEARMMNLQTGAELPLGDDHVHAHAYRQDHQHGHAPEHSHAHDHGDGTVHDHRHSHSHDHHHAHDELHDHEHHDHHHHGHGGHDHTTSVVDLEARILAKNDQLATRNRGWFEGREILALNIVSSPGAGKTTLLERAIRALKEREGGDLQVMGSLTLARTLVEADLVDELNLMIEPVRLGGGKRLFPDDGRARPMRLVSHAIASTGVMVCKYQPTGEPLRPGHSDELYEDPDRPPVTPG